MGPVLGLDVGDRRIGLALSDNSRLIASPHSVLTRTNIRNDIRAMVELVARLAVTEVVAGWPLQPNGKPGQQAQRVERFISPLGKALGYEVKRMDERMSSVAAERALREAGVRYKKQKQIVDKVAAALILQAWLDAHGK